MNINRKFLMTETKLTDINMKNGEVEVYSETLSVSDLTELRAKGSKTFILGITSSGVPLLFKGESDAKEVFEYLRRMDNKYDVIAIFIGDMIKKYIYIDKTTSYDWQFVVGREEIKRLKRQFERIFINYNLPF